MGTFDVIDKISTLPLLKYKGVVDFVDKMSFIASCIILIGCSLIVTLREYVMDPISCYMAQNPGGENILKFIENYCWVQGTMTFSDHKIPDSDVEWREFEKSRIVYYQWVPFMLLFQAALFHIPKIIWTVICFNMTGFNVEHMIQKSDTIDTVKIAEMMENLLVQHREYRTGYFPRIKSKVHSFVKCFVISKRFATWLTFGYLLMKCLYLLNSIGQIYLMQVFLQLNSKDEYSSNFGFEIAKNIIKGRNWEATAIFPRVTYCLARVKQMAAINTITAQCVLTANLFIEKIYIFLWFWIVIVAIFTAFSFITWLFRMFIPYKHSMEIRKYLTLQGYRISKSDPIDKFVNNFLRLDGVFILYMIKVNSGDLITGAIVSELYRRYCNNYDGKDFLEDGIDFLKDSGETLKPLSNNVDTINKGAH